MGFKVKIVTSRGTSIREEEYKPSKWVGGEFRAEQKKKMSLIPTEAIICTHRGTKATKIAEYPAAAEMLSRRGFVISTAKGTGIRIL